MHQYLKLLIKLEAGDGLPEEALAWAYQQIENGIESENVMKLAWINNPSLEVVISIFRNALKELNISIPGNYELKILIAKHIAENIISERINANAGCNKIAKINRELDWPKELSGFGMLAHEQTDHEYLGITAESLRESIIEEARNLVNAT